MDAQSRDILDKTDACEEALVTAIEGYPFSVIVVVLIALAGEMVGMRCRSKAELAYLLDRVALAVRKHAENGFEMSGGGDVQ